MNLAINGITTQEMMILAENLNRFMLERKIDSKILHQATGISVSAINALRRGEGNPTLTTMLELAKFFNCSIDALVGLDKNDTGVVRNLSKTIPVYGLTDSVNRFTDSIIEYIAENCGAHQEHDLFAIKIHNSVYAPFFEKGSYFIVSKTIKYSDGDIVLVNIKGNVIVRKIFTTNAGQVKFFSISIQPEISQYEAFELVGVVIKIIQPLY